MAPVSDIILNINKESLFFFLILYMHISPYLGTHETFPIDAGRGRRKEATSRTCRAYCCFDLLAYLNCLIVLSQPLFSLLLYFFFRNTLKLPSTRVSGMYFKILQDIFARI